MVFTGAADVGAPRGEFGAAFFGGRGIFIGYVVHGAAEGVEGGHGVACCMSYTPRGGWLGGRMGGRPPVSASVGL